MVVRRPLRRARRCAFPARARREDLVVPAASALRWRRRKGSPITMASCRDMVHRFKASAGAPSSSGRRPGMDHQPQIRRDAVGPDRRRSGCDDAPNRARRRGVSMERIPARAGLRSYGIGRAWLGQIVGVAALPRIAALPCAWTGVPTARSSQSVWFTEANQPSGGKPQDGDLPGRKECPVKSVRKKVARDSHETALLLAALLAFGSIQHLAATWCCYALSAPHRRYTNVGGFIHSGTTRGTARRATELRPASGLRYLVAGFVVHYHADWLKTKCRRYHWGDGDQRWGCTFGADLLARRWLSRRSFLVAVRASVRIRGLPPRAFEEGLHPGYQSRPPTRPDRLLAMAARRSRLARRLKRCSSSCEWPNIASTGSLVIPRTRMRVSAVTVRCAARRSSRHLGPTTPPVASAPRAIVILPAEHMMRAAPSRMMNIEAAVSPCTIVIGAARNPPRLAGEPRDCSSLSTWPNRPGDAARADSLAERSWSGAAPPASRLRGGPAGSRPAQYGGLRHWCRPAGKQVAQFVIIDRGSWSGSRWAAACAPGPAAAPP